MTISLSFYAKVIDKICIAYCGNNPQYAIELDKLIPTWKESYPDFHFTLSLPTSLLHLSPLAIPYETLNKLDYAFIKEFRDDPKRNVISDWMG